VHSGSELVTLSMMRITRDQTSSCHHNSCVIEADNHILLFFFQRLNCLYYRITEWFWLEGTLKDYLVNPLCHGQGHLPLDQVAQSHIQAGLERLQ